MDKVTQKRITESNYGRDFGWFVELDGKRVAELTAPEWDQNMQFWFIYTLTPLTEDEGIRAQLHSDEFWKWTELVFRSREFGLVAPDAIGVLLPDGRVSAKWLDLYSELPRKTIPEKLLGWFAIVVCALLVGCAPHDAKTASELSEGYKFEFEAEPPTGVTVLNARQMSVRDLGAQWLRIQAETNAIDAILLKKFTRQTRPPEGLASAKSKHTPDWWVLPPPSQLEYYTCQNWTRGTWHSSRAVIAVHRADGIVFFYCERID